MKPILEVSGLLPFQETLSIKPWCLIYNNAGQLWEIPIWFIYTHKKENLIDMISNLIMIPFFHVKTCFVFARLRHIKILDTFIPITSKRKLLFLWKKAWKFCVPFQNKFISLGCSCCSDVFQFTRLSLFYWESWKISKQTLSLYLDVNFCGEEVVLKIILPAYG